LAEEIRIFLNEVISQIFILDIKNLQHCRAKFLWSSGLKSIFFGAREINVSDLFNIRLEIDIMLTSTLGHKYNKAVTQPHHKNDYWASNTIPLGFLFYQLLPLHKDPHPYQISRAFLYISLH
jgi:hypothetical protein